MLEPFNALLIAQSLFKSNDWKGSLDGLIKSVRAGFIFDNMALYRAEPDSRLSEIVYARAVGRGQRAEADAAWGEIIANQVMATNQMVLQQPAIFDPDGDRMAQACMLALPLKIPEKLLGVLIFIRFGGPPFSEEQIHQAEFVASQVSFLMERQMLLTELSQLEDARRTMQLQQDFISTVSHELRTPLGFIKGYSTTLLRNDTTWDIATQREFLTIIDEEADHLTQLIENVLESARLQSNTLPMDFQPIRIDTIIRDVAMRVQARYKELELKIELPAVFIHADTVRLAQVFENLISNAVKYAPGSPVLVRGIQEGTKLHLKVIDRGPGISPEHLQFLFDRFYRVPGETASGTGLGLFICKQIIQAHHGEIWVESVKREGSTFHVVLPIRQQGP